MAAQALTKQIYKPWNQHKVTMTLFVNVTAVFDSVSYKRLFYKLKKPRVPALIPIFISCFIRNRHTEWKLPKTSISII